MLPKLATPKYDMIVPSTGEAITYRPYVVKEEKILLIALETDNEVAIERSVVDIIKACVESPLDIKTLTNFDIEFMFTVLRSKSVGEGIKVQLKCEQEKCEQTDEIKINLEEVFVSNLDKEHDKHYKINDDISVDLKWLGFSDSLTQAQRNTETEAAINMVAKTIETIYYGEETFATKDAPFKEVVRFVESLGNDQFTELVKRMSDAPTLTYKMEYACSKCGNEHKRELKGLSDFFT
jgi:hypothetical protein